MISYSAPVLDVSALRAKDFLHLMNMIDAEAKQRQTLSYSPGMFGPVTNTTLDMVALRAYLELKAAEEAKDNGACTRPEGCVCGGDTERVRKACANWSEA